MSYLADQHHHHHGFGKQFNYDDQDNNQFDGTWQSGLFHVYVCVSLSAGLFRPSAIQC